MIDSQNAKLHTIHTRNHVTVSMKSCSTAVSTATSLLAEALSLPGLPADSPAPSVPPDHEVGGGRRWMLQRAENNGFNSTRAEMKRTLRYGGWVGRLSPPNEPSLRLRALCNCREGGGGGGRRRRRRRRRRRIRVDRLSKVESRGRSLKV